MSKKEKNSLSKEDLLEFLENLPQLRLSKSEKEYCVIKWPSQQWNDVKHINVKAGPEETEEPSYASYFQRHQTEVNEMNECEARRLLQTILSILDLSWTFLNEEEKDKLATAVTQVPEKDASLLKQHLPQLSRSSKLSKKIKEKDRKPPKSHQQMLDENLQYHGLSRKDVLADGNCMFHAVADQLVRLGVKDYDDHKNVRTLAVENLDQLPYYIEGDLEEYKEKMRIDGQWGGGNELQALAYALGRTIRVVTHYNKDEMIYEAKESAKKLESIRLGYNGLHYYSLVPVPSTAEQQKQKEGKEHQEEEDYDKKQEQDDDDDDDDESHKREKEQSAEMEMEPCLCNGIKRCAHGKGDGKCSCRANSLNCSEECSCDPLVCKNRACLCKDPKKCANGSGDEKCPCKSAGLKCSQKCSCSPFVCINREKVPKD